MKPFRDRKNQGADEMQGWLDIFFGGVLWKTNGILIWKGVLPMRDKKVGGGSAHAVIRSAKAPPSLEARVDSSTVIFLEVARVRLGFKSFRSVAINLDRTGALRVAINSTYGS